MVNRVRMTKNGVSGGLFTKIHRPLLMLQPTSMHKGSASDVCSNPHDGSALLLWLSPVWQATGNERMWLCRGDRDDAKFGDLYF